MPDREKVIKGLEHVRQTDFDMSQPTKNAIDDALVLLKEQEDLGAELTNAVELIHKKNERIEKLTKEQPQIVRCKDCKKKGDAYLCRLDSDLLEHGGHRTDEYDNWFCADGEENR